MSVIGYKVLERSSAGDLTHAVKELMEFNEGWEPTGGIAIDANAMTYVQAMVRRQPHTVGGGK